jgi:dolichyl-phosphate beta-glucosyltransferase
MEPIIVSVIIPCYNSAAVLAKNLPPLINNLQQMKTTFEIIIVNDGSKDEADLKEIIKNFRVIYLSNDFNQGKGEALRKGFKTAKGDIQIFTDPDIPYTFEAFRQIIHHLTAHEADLIIGDRLAKNSLYYHKIGFVRRWGSRFVSFFLGTLVTGGYYDTQCGIKGFTKQSAEKIFAWSSIQRFAIDIEIIYLALKFHYTIKKIPVKLRSSDGSTVKVFKDGIRLIKDVFRIKYHYEKKKREYRIKKMG